LSISVDFRYYWYGISQELVCSKIDRMFELQYSEKDLLQGAAELKFDAKLLDRWEALMKAGHFRYQYRVQAGLRNRFVSIFLLSLRLNKVPAPVSLTLISIRDALDTGFSGYLSNIKAGYRISGRIS
jgi:hypothetical protein